MRVEGKFRKSWQPFENPVPKLNFSRMHPEFIRVLDITLTGSRMLCLRVLGRLSNPYAETTAAKFYPNLYIKIENNVFDIDI